MEPTRHNSVASAAARGFTLVEMIVVVAIIGIITTIAVAGQGSFNRSMVLTETAYTVAFSIREAQALGVSSRIFGTIQNAGYGVHFATGRDTSYDLFADIVPVAAGNTQNATLCPGHSTGTGPEAKPGNCRLDNATEVVRTYSFNNGFRILKFCGRESGGTLRCSDLGGTQNLTALAISYLRPSTQSTIVGTRSGTYTALTEATIYIGSPDGSSRRCVYITKVGQVSVHSMEDPICS